MNFYPTRYTELTNAEVNELYRSETWEGLSRDERLDALQELENRSAGSLGNLPCEVELEHMNGAQYGVYCDGVIYVNESLVENGEFTVQYEDSTTDSYSPTDTNAQLMDTIHHENYHAYQDDTIHGRVEHDNVAEVEQWKANDEYYIRDGQFYRLQSLEKSAFEHGEAQTKAAFEEIEAKYGADAGYRDYLENIEGGYEKAVAHAERFGDENIAGTLNQTILDKYQANHAESNTNDVSSEKISDTSGVDTSAAQISNDIEDSL